MWKGGKAEGFFGENAYLGRPTREERVRGAQEGWNRRKGQEDC